MFNFEVDKFLQTLLRLEQWQERLAGTRQPVVGVLDEPGLS
jgi:hypothetical protein